MSSVIDQNGELGARAARRLREEIVVWLTTITPAGSPLPRPVWFLWDGEDEVLLYSRQSARVRNIERNPSVTLNFDGDGQGGDIIVLSAEAAIDWHWPPAHEHDEYLKKYADRIAGIGMNPQTFARSYKVPVRIRLKRLDGH
jgi:PPOX class probable F420-dependent enzyme